MRRLVRAVLAVFLSLSPVAAQEPLPGHFIAFKACEAFLSKNRMTNPGEVRTAPMRSYEMIGINRAGGAFYQIRIPDAPVRVARWVHAKCGLHVADAGDVASKQGLAPVLPISSAEKDSFDNVLAISWQPTFCETRPDKPECQSLNAGGLPVAETRFSIHGLWPQPRGIAYCGVPRAVRQLDGAGRWQDLPPVEIDADTRGALAVAMPGTASFLERHEWIKHGTCYGAADGADEYYDDTLHLLAAVNRSSVAEFMASHVSDQIATAELRARFDDAFGPGAGDRVQVHCAGDGGRVLIQELRLSLRGRIDPDTALGDLMRAADPVPPGCGRGVVDPAGLQ